MSHPRSVTQEELHLNRLTYFSKHPNASAPSLLPSTQDGGLILEAPRYVCIYVSYRQDYSSRLREMLLM